ncbi:hypothetical protein GT641_01020 [Clostridium sp. BIOML-A1]|jgi:hypothetical protein|uniref:Ig-like domain-containing protein n=1 Tax=Clostridium sp. BIOML-A1 TaxID=2584627 RepID=UPI00136E7FDB|nr:Ig-like domain-containing protein [Clostridium sp. BIOML-A1]MZH15855.1 hypothetical protein [Clostridium sp. BIOML-A1]
MKERRKNSPVRRILAWVIAAAVAVSILTIPQTESYAAGGKVTKVAVSNLPAKQLTLKKGKTFTLKPKVTVTGKISKKVTYKTSNKKVVAVNAKGKITAKKKGTAKIYVISKADKKKKCTITVTVGTPVTKVKLNKTKSTMTVGKKQTLKATVTPKKASSRAVVWKSSNTKIATVSSKGIVKAKKAGMVTITAIAKDGSGKKATCKITVKKKTVKPANDPTPVTPTPTEPVVINSLTILGNADIQVVLSAEQALSASDFTVSSKVNGYGNYVRKCVLDSVTTTDQITYRIHLNRQDVLFNSNMVQVSVPKLKTSKEAVYRKAADEITTGEVKIFAKGDGFNTKKDITYYKPNISGLAVFTVGELPPGVSYKEVQKGSASNYLEFTGVFTASGIYTTKIDVVDELGNKIHHTVTWKVWDAQTIVAEDIIQYGYLQNPDAAAGKPDGAYTSKSDAQILPRGGSSTYTYEVVSKADCMELTPDGFYAYGTIDTRQAGTYTMKVKITDKKNSAIFTYCTVTFVIEKGIRVKGTFVDLDGHKIKNTVSDTFCCYIKSKWMDRAYSIDLRKEIGKYNSSTGTVYFDVPEGNYDIRVVNKTGGVEKYLENYTVSTSTSNNYQIVLPLYQITVASDNTALSASSFGEWEETDGTLRGKGEYLYLPVGNYTLTGIAEKNGVTYQATLQISVTDTTRSATVTAHVVAK